jgi:16S rRNA processing protein RimM
LRAKTTRKSEAFLTLGKVGRPHGLRGAFFVSGREDPLPRHLKTVLIGKSPETATEAKVTQSSMQANRPLLICSLADDRTAAERLTNLNIYAPQASVKAKAKPDEIYWVDLEGAEVFGSEGKLLGKITHVYNAGASDVATIESSEGKTVDVALVAEYVGKKLKLDSLAGRRQLHLVVPADTFDEVWDDA